MKKVQKQLKRALSMALALSMVVGMLSGCGLGRDTASDVVVVQDSVTEVNEISLSSMDQDTFLLSAGETPQLKFETANGIVTDITVTPDDTTLQPYQYYTVTFTLTANENESFTKTASITLNGVELKVKKWAKDQLIIEYTTLALPETVTTDEMAKVTSYGDAASERSLGTAKVQALLDSDLTLYSEDGKESYTVQKGYVPLFMVPSFVANGEPEQIKDGERVQIIKEHGEEDFPGAAGEWYRIAYRGKVGYLPGTFVKDAKVQVSSEDKGKTSEITKPTNKTAQTRPAVKPSAGQNNQTTAQNAGNNSTNSSGSSSESSENNSGSNSSGGSGSTSGSNSGSNSGSDSGNIDKTVYYQIDFDLGGGIDDTDALLPKSLLVASNYVIDINQLATPSVPGYLFRAWYYDSAMTRQVQSGDKINSDLTLYAKMEEISADTESTQGVDNYISSVDVDANSFQIIVLKEMGARSAENGEEVAMLHNLAEPANPLPIRISDPKSVTIDGNSYEQYSLSFDQLEQGETYQMQLLNSSYVFCYDGVVQPEAVRLYNFTTEMTVKEIENLKFNTDLIYLKESEVKYTEGSDYLSGLFHAEVDANMTQLNTVDGKGSFTYSGDQKIDVGTTVVIYSGDKVPKLGEEGFKAAKQYDGNVAYVTISKVEGSTYYYGAAEAEDVLFTPDVLPLNIADDEDGRDNDTVKIDTVKLDYSGSIYEGMGLGADTTVDVGDYLAFYSGSIQTATELTYGRITEITRSGEDTILTYVTVGEDEVLDAMTVYGTDEMDFELDEDTAQKIEQQMEQQAMDSGFAVEAANYLATVALATEEMQSLTGEMGLQSLSLTKEDGSLATQSDIALYSGGKVNVEGLQVHANISRKLENLAVGNVKNGARAQLEVSFNVEMGSGKNRLVLKVAATFEQEILLNLNIHGKTIWGKKWIFPYIKDYRITTNLDAGSYTGVGITTTITAEGKEPDYDWSKVNKNLSDQIKDLMNAKDKFFNQDIGSTGGGLAEKYAAMLDNNPDWIELVNVNIFSTESKILLGVIVVGVQGDFVVSAKVNIMMGMTFNYSIAKRYSFTLNIFSKSSSSDCVDLIKSNYNFDLYVMGTLGLRAGIRLTVYTGLFSKKLASIGITAEAGAYVQMWGYFYYSTSWQAGSGKSSSASGAMLMEVGAYLEIRFLASAFGGRFSYNPVLYDKYWPLWNLGSPENVYSFKYKSTAGEVDAMDVNMGASQSVALPADRMSMSYMNLRDGKTAEKNYSYNDFTITTTGNFKYENGVISVVMQDGSNEEKGTVILTWKGAPLSFTSNPLSMELDLTWSDPSRVQSVSYELHGGTAYENGTVLTEGIPTAQVITGGKLTAPVVELKREHYVFGGWYVDTKAGAPWNFDTDKVKENLVLHAKWIPVEYKIAYELNGGTNAETNPEAYTVEDTVKLAEPVRAGYQFAGWNTAADGTGINVTEIPVGSSGEKTYYAQWTPLEQTYEMHHLLEKLDGSGYDDKETTTDTALTDATVVVGANQSRAYTGFTYNDALTVEKAQNSGTIPGEGTLVLNLYYSRNRYTVTLRSGVGTDNNVSVPYEGKVAQPEAPSRAGYTFTGWYVADQTPREWNFETDIITENTTIYAGWTANTYNVTFDLQNGIGGDATVLATYDSAMPQVVVPARAGYQFKGYFDAADGGKQYYNADGSSAANWDKSESETDSFVLYAQWTANTYTVTFDANGGSGTMEAQTMTYDTDAKFTKNTLTKEGYLFAGWANEAGADSAAYADEETVRNLTANQGETLTLYAVWQPVSYCVAFDGNGADSGSMDAQQFTYDKETVLPLNGYQKTGYHFIGWAVTKDADKVAYADRASVQNLTAENGATVNLYAVWEPNTYQIAFYGNGGEGTMESQSFIYDDTKRALAKNLYRKTGYSFIGWATTENADTATYQDEQKVQNLITQESGVLTLYAVWKANTYTLRFDSNQGEGSSIPTTAEPMMVTFGKVYGTLPDVFRAGYDFTGWYTRENIAILPDNVVDITADTTLYAHWTAKKYTVSFDSNQGEGSTEPTKANNLQAVYDTVYGNLPEVSRTGYTFTGWYTRAIGGSQVQSTDTVTMTGDLTLYARWTANVYQVTFHGKGGTFAGDVTDQVVGQNFDSTYQLPVTPTRTGYTFLGWYTGENSGDKVEGTDKMTTAKNHDLYAQWKANTYTVTFKANGGTGIMNDQTMTYDRSTRLNSNQFTRTGYIFCGWSKSASATVKTYSDKQTVSNLTSGQGDTVTLYAVWEATKYNVRFDANGGTGTMASQQFTYDRSTALRENSFTRENFEFLGWSTSAAAEEVEYKDTAIVKNLSSTGEDVYLYAVWKGAHNTLTFDTNKGDGSTTPSPATIPSRDMENGTKYGTLPTVSRDGYTFQGWYTAKKGGTQITEDSTVDLSRNTTLYAIWKPNEYTLNFDTNKGTGSTTPDPVNSYTIYFDGNYGTGEDAALPETSRKGYTFDGWYTAAEGGEKFDNTIRVTATPYTTLYAHWTAKEYTITYDGSGYVGGRYSDGTWEKKDVLRFDQAYTFPEEPTCEGYAFQEWRLNSEEVTNDNLWTLLDADKENATLNASFKCVSVWVGEVMLINSDTTPAYAKTDADGKVTAGGSEKDYNIKLLNGILYLNNANIVSSERCIDTGMRSLTIELAASTTNNVKSTSYYSTDHAIYVLGDLHITGSGALTVQSSNRYSYATSIGIWLVGGLSIDTAEKAVINIYGGVDGPDCTSTKVKEAVGIRARSVSIKNAEVNVYGYHHAIQTHSGGTMKLTNSKGQAVSSTATDCSALHSLDKSYPLKTKVDKCKFTKESTNTYTWIRSK